MAAAVAGLDPAEQSRAFLYSPVEGLADLRRRWRERQRQGVPEELPSSLPLVTAGPVQGLALLAELLAGEGSAVVLPAGAPAGYAATFTLRTGARLAALGELAGGEPALVVVATPQTGGAGDLPEALAAAAAPRPLAVVVDDAVLPGGGPRRSLFWRLVGLHPSLVPFLVDAPGPSLGAAGDGLGFLTLPFPPGSDLAEAFESKLKTLLRALVGSPPAFAQVLLLEALGAA